MEITVQPEQSGARDNWDSKLARAWAEQPGSVKTAVLEMVRG